ncbi:tRNA adenosine deaminase-associated protein [Solicola gregarius]|uniref:tRNA adenosine deaminase-associated protein n=1 Tax=Solicola gregarius TaxID=2908642 RepID=A0AA46TNM0_9ACTN|nr:tRNA adenosine deaminase-associated protein [Solicola gregarius]UYM07688.1 tRNA adenosine deaminase-associated protein [Solicola gregarius]
MADDSVDFAVVAYREEGIWQLATLPRAVGEDIDDLITALRPWPGDAGVLGLVSVDEDFFVLVRVAGDDVRVFLSDVTAVTEWPLASSIAEYLDLPDPDDDEEPQPAGDSDVVQEFGMTAVDLAVLCDDDELYPDEMLSDVAERLGFGAQLASIVEAAKA